MLLQEGVEGGKEVGHWSGSVADAGAGDSLGDVLTGQVHPTGRSFESGPRRQHVLLRLLQRHASRADLPVATPAEATRPLDKFKSLDERKRMR